ncbi:MAG: 30S ribosomal protein S10 [Candidatus Zeuxoniibacter abyssi]|nr:MAG: 30S ribosomal protein S10 [Candidatus Persebacteraceae bacterium AB1(2)]
MAKKQKTTQKFRIRLSGFDHRLLDQSTDNIVNTVKRSGAQIYGPVPLPVRRRRYDFLRSPHKDKTSREQMEIREHSRRIDIVDVSSKATNALTSLDLPAGVQVDIKVLFTG